MSLHIVTANKAGKTSFYRLVKAAQKVVDLWGYNQDAEFIELRNALAPFKALP